MEIKNMTITDIETRAAEIKAEMEAEDADLDALTAEVDALEERKAELKAEAQKHIQEAEKVADGMLGETKESFKEKKKMTYEEMRGSHEYAVAYANYIKTGKADECRALMAKCEQRDAGDPLTTENVGGSIAVPVSVEGRVRTAWEKDELMSRVRKTFFKGNHKVFYEVSGTDAVAHTEGGEAVTAEELVLGTVNQIAISYKKWLPITDEVLDLTGEDFLFYIYDEITYRIVKALGDALLTEIATIAAGGAGPSVTATDVSAVGLDTITQALANLSEDAQNPVIIMNKLTWSAIETARAAAGYAFDPYYGLPIIFKSALPGPDDASEGDPLIIVGDLGEGANCNLPNGYDVKFKFDDLTEMTSDVVRILGRLFAAINVVAPYAFAVITQGEAA